MNTCEVCKKANPEHLDRCDDHYKCDHCGKKENLCFYNSGVYCSDCWEQIIQDRINNFQGDTKFSDEIVCPYCGYVVDNYVVDNYVKGMVCDDCGNDFDMERHVLINYTTKKG